MRKIKNIISGLLTCTIICAVPTFLMFILFVAIFTPEKTNKGEFTDPIKYWFSDKYLCENFNNNNICKGEK